MAVRNLRAFRDVVEFKNVENLKLCRRDCGSIGAPLQHYSCLGSASRHVNRTANNLPLRGRHQNDEVHVNRF